MLLLAFASAQKSLCPARSQYTLGNTCLKSNLVFVPKAVDPCSTNELSVFTASPGGQRMQMIHLVGAICSYVDREHREEHLGLCLLGSTPKGTASHNAVLCPLGGGAIALAYMSRSLWSPVSTCGIFRGWWYLGECVFGPFVMQWLLFGSTGLTFQSHAWVVRSYRVLTGARSPFPLASTSPISCLAIQEPQYPMVRHRVIIVKNVCLSNITTE